MSEYVVILDAGSQYAKVIDRKVRELRVDTRILPLATDPQTIANDPHALGVIISGGPSSVTAAGAPSFDEGWFHLNKPLLGICYGMQLMAKAFYGKVGNQRTREDGQQSIHLALKDCKTQDGAGCALFDKLGPERETVLLTHGDCVLEVGEELEVCAASEQGIIAALQHRTLPLVGVQFHPEVELTVNGVAMLRNFLAYAKFSFSFNMADRKTVALEHIRERTKEGQKVLSLVSGGVDSTVCTALLLEALGKERVVCVHVDHGFMRLNESANVVKELGALGAHIHVVDGASTFAHATTNIPATKANPVAHQSLPLNQTELSEEKRHIIGDTFMKVSNEAIVALKLDMEHLLLAQGTLRPDLIESGSHTVSLTADAIKTHHNDTAVVRQLRSQGKIIEPLSEYHKDEVRALGRMLGLSESLVERQPFPGPGLAIRILCASTPAVGPSFEQTVKCLGSMMDGNEGAAATTSPSEVASSVRIASLFKALDLVGCVLPVRTVGVQGDGRTYSNAVALSPRSTSTIMPTDAAQWKDLLSLATLIPHTAHGVNRVTYVFGAVPTTITEARAVRTVSHTRLTPDIIDMSREADAAVNRVLDQFHLVRKLSQVPVILIPVSFEETEEARRVKTHSVVIRTFLTSDFMTGVPAVPGTDAMPMEALKAMVDAVSRLTFVSRVLYDCTAKPPGTTEWE